MTFGIIIDGKKQRGKIAITDQPKWSDVIKIGKEINLMKRCGEKHRVDREFGKEANAMFKKKENKELNKEMATYAVEQLKRKFKRG